MRNAGRNLLCLILVFLAVTAGCSSGTPAKPETVVDPNTRLSPSNITYSNYGLSFEYPDNIAMVERGLFGEKKATWDDGAVNMRDSAGDNITISWMKMHRRPPNIPLVYEGLWTSTKQDPRISDVKIYNLQTYPSTTCGDATFIGRMSYFSNVQNVPTNEGLMIWYNASQDRLYSIDIASGVDYFIFIKRTLDRYQESFRCSEF